MRIRFITLVLAIAAPLLRASDHRAGYEAELLMNFGSGDFAPYYIASNRGGIITQSGDALLRLGINGESAVGPFGYIYGAEAVAGYSTDTDYLSYDSEKSDLIHLGCRPASAWIKQLYAGLTYRSLFINAGLKDYRSLIADRELSSGDVVESGNARNIPQVRAGFRDFQDIPFTRGAVQITGSLAFGRFADNSYLRHHFNYYSGHITTGQLYHYKSIYFRTDPRRPFSVTAGAQIASVFGGETVWYHNGEETKRVKNRSNFKAFMQALVPRENGVEGFYEGSHLGSWDFSFRYLFQSGRQLRAYVMNLWENGSGMAFKNGWDRLYGLEYRSSSSGWIDAAVVEYLDFTNQGGPIHWDLDDAPGTTLDVKPATGDDNYYNNDFFNSYANFGMSMGSPFLKSPVYNTDGNLQFTDNRVRGFHIGISGTPLPAWSYRLLTGYRSSWGTYRNPRLSVAHDFSAMAEVTYRPAAVGGLQIKAQIAADRGSIYGDCTGGSLSVIYTGILNIRK